MTNWRDGTVNFEQRGVEFPSSWSVNATNIVTSKYFRGAVGLAAAGVQPAPAHRPGGRGLPARRGEHGYFATDADAEIFAHELTWMLLHQVFSFNSPVWFNVGTVSPQQVSACFILSVDDTMESILNWYREEGLIFKGGSGAGLNLSRIRSSKELLSSGGTASGPVVVHARRRRQRGHHQVRWRHPAGGEDGRAGRRPPRHRGVRADQGQGGGQDPGAARRRVRHGPRWLGHRLGAVPEREQLGAGHRRVHARRRGRRASSGCAPGRPARSSRPSTPRSCSADRPGGLGVRRPRHPVRQHDQRLAHLPGVRPDHRVQPVQRVHSPARPIPRRGCAVTATWSRAACR